MKSATQDESADRAAPAAVRPHERGYLPAVPRAAVLLFVSAMFLLAHGSHLFPPDAVSRFITESEDSVSKDSIFTAILIFRLYSAAIALMVFTSLAALARLWAEKAFGPLGFLRRAAVYAAAGSVAALLLYGRPAPAALALLLLAAAAAVIPPDSLRKAPGWTLIPGLIEAVAPGSAAANGRLGLAAYAFTAALCLGDLALNGWPGLAAMKAAPERLAAGNFYGLEADPASGRVSACKVRDRQVLTFGLEDGILLGTAAVATSLELQEIKANPARKEVYHFDRELRALLVLDPETLQVEKRAIFGGSGPGGSARVAYDNAGNSLAAVLEHGPLFLADLDSLRLRTVLKDVNYNEFVLFNPDARVYLLSFFRGRDTVLAVSGDGKTKKELPAGRFQGGMAFSRKRGEVYLAMPLQARVLVYDSATLEPKGAIRAGFGVRGLACDDENDLLLAASMCNGSMDVIELRGGRRAARVPLGYYLREIALDTAGRKAFVSSIAGGVMRTSY